MMGEPLPPSHFMTSSTDLGFHDDAAYPPLLPPPLSGDVAPDEGPSLPSLRLLHSSGRDLLERLELRRWSGGAHFRLDLRGAGLRGGRVALRDPSHPRWPNAGRTTDCPLEARAWLESYLIRLGGRWFLEDQSTSTVGHWAEVVLQRLEASSPAGSRLLANRRSHVQVHILPRLGSTRIWELDRRRVQTFFDDLRSAHRGSTAHLAPGTRRGVATTLAVIVRAATGKDPEWVEELVRSESRGVLPSDACTPVDVGTRFDGFTLEERRSILVAAMELDLAAGRRRRGSWLPGLADEVAFLLHHVCRLQDLSSLWTDDFGSSHVQLRGTKSRAGELRIHPIQESYRPWLRRLLKYAQGEPGFAFPGRSPHTARSSSTIERHVRQVLEHAGLKPVGLCTHSFRKVNYSLALGAGIGRRVLDVMAGHAGEGPDPGLRHYLCGENFAEALPPECFRFIPPIGSPEEILTFARKRLDERGEDGGKAPA